MADSDTLPQRVLERLLEAVKNILNPSFYEYTLREIGASLGQEIVSHIRPFHPTAAPFRQGDYLRCLEWMKAEWGWNHEVKMEAKGLINISIPYCPFDKLTAEHPHLCQIEAGILGGIAGDHFNYGKVEICKGSGMPPQKCSLVVHLEQTARSAIVEGPTFPLAPPEVKVAPTVGPKAKTVGQLSSREQQILRLIGEGLPDKAIANALHLSVRTVEGHTARIRKKTGLGTRAALIRLALRWSTSEWQ